MEAVDGPDQLSTSGMEQARVSPNGIGDSCSCELVASMVDFGIKLASASREFCPPKFNRASEAVGTWYRLGTGVRYIPNRVGESRSGAKEHGVEVKRLGVEQ